MQQNTIEYPRNGYRSRSLGIKKSLCSGAEWPRKANASFFGTLDVGEFDG